VALPVEQQVDLLFELVERELRAEALARLHQVHRKLDAVDLRQEAPVRRLSVRLRLPHDGRARGVRRLDEQRRNHEPDQSADSRCDRQRTPIALQRMK